MTVATTAARRFAAITLCVAAPLAASCLTARADATARRPGAELFITVRTAAGEARSMRLTCEPDGGIHPRPEEACDALREVDGDIDALPVDDRPCTFLYQPVRAEVRGHWGDTETDYARDFPNACVMRRHLSPLV
ncbi:SSI family serine proteinase inhibitor [Nonomuraea pusilla]|uniref:Subtilisin inhibitor-like n=1 Tax=Nonomuraea pusilla TaxID=46177 RepID=A0A1H7LY21_9ACTN|nr:SSI family serine proteinase inhibitor [Nonomuraea pusilla]SEL03900.1 Subtilisin inhibitor-like [Nonomuraea pusilla]